MNLRILGAGGHAKVAIEAWRSVGYTVGGVYDDDQRLIGTEILGLRVVGDTATALGSEDPLHIAIGNNGTRAGIAGRAADDRFPIIVHASAHLSPTAAIGAGTLICAGAVVQAEARIGRHVIVNSLALVEHDVEIGDFVHIGPGVRLGGAVRIGAKVLIGIGAIVLPGILVDEGAVVGAGAVVNRDVGSGETVIGNPARRLR